MARISCSDLLARGDLAIHTRDLDSLAHVATVLATRVSDPLGAHCLDLARECRRGSKHALRAWPLLRKAVADHVAIAGT
jgi:hypothetical protein